MIQFLRNFKQFCSIAVQDNNMSMVKYLVNHGANLCVKAIDGMSAFHAACQNGSLEMVQLLVRKINRNSTISFDRKCNFYFTFFKYEYYNIDLNLKDYNGATSLHYGNKTCFQLKKLLISHILNAPFMFEKRAIMATRYSLPIFWRMELKSK
jgi:hypothetical protein